MRLLVVSQYFWPEDFRINELVAEMRHRGHEVTVLTGEPNYPDGEVFPAFRRDRASFSCYEGASIERVPIAPRGRGKLRLFFNYVSYAISASTLGAFRVSRSEYDVIFVFGPSPITVCLPAIVLRRLRQWPVAFWVLDLWPETLSAVGIVKSPALLGLVGRFVRFIYSQCDLVLAPSKSMVKQIARYAVGRARIEYFPNWVELGYSSGEAESAPEIESRDDLFTVLFAGNIGEAQDFPTILRAAELLKNEPVRWVVLGQGRMGDWLKQEVASRGLAGKVLMPGRFPIARMPSFYTHASVLLVSLKTDPIFSLMIPGKLQSYMAFGLPVIGMLDGEGAAVIEEAAAGLTCPSGDSAGLAGAVMTMVAMSRSGRDAMGASGRAYAAKEFDRDRLISGLENTLLELSRRNPANEAA